MRCYEELKHEVRSCSTLLPKKEQTFQQGGSSIASKLSREEKFALITDVESFIKYQHNIQKGSSPVPLDCMIQIFHLAFNLGSFTKYDTYNKLSQYFRSRIKNRDMIPWKLQHRKNIRSLVWEMRKEGYKYFTHKGLIVENQ